MCGELNFLEKRKSVFLGISIEAVIQKICEQTISKVVVIGNRWI